MACRLADTCRDPTCRPPVYPCGETTRSAATASTTTSGSDPLQVVEAIGNPADLTALGIRVSQYLEQWAETTTQIVVCIDSLTVLLHYVELERVYRFLHVLSGRLRSVEARAYLLAPDAHDAQTVAVLQTLMDDTIDLQ